MLNNIRSEKTQRSRRKRECAECTRKIDKNELYVCKQIRYDKTIISLYYHQMCNQPKHHPAT